MMLAAQATAVVRFDADERRYVSQACTLVFDNKRRKCPLIYQSRRRRIPPTTLVTNSNKR